MTRLILIRHGQTIWNKELKYQGHTDIVLSDDGIRQAELVARRLKQENIAAIYASDLSRAFFTADAIAQEHKLQVIRLPELREIKFGEWEGLTYTAIHEKWPEEMARLYTHADEISIPGGETFSQLKERASGAISRIVEEHRGQTIVAVSHGGTIRTILCAILGISLNHVWDIRQDNAAVNIVEYHYGRAIVSLVNDTHHLASQYS